MIVADFRVNMYFIFHGQNGEMEMLATLQLLLQIVL